VRYITLFGRLVLPVIGLALTGLGVLFAVPGVTDFVQGPFWFLLKILVFLFVYVWVRGTLPRFRYDQLMGFGWKLLLPLAILNVVITSLAIVVTQR
jgi:NADH-quinone oxidoreductase subunit H